MDMTELLGSTYRDDTELVAIVGRKLLHDKYFPMVNKDQVPSEKMAADVIISQKRMGGLPAVRVPSFPDNAILITRLDNLSIYWQEGKIPPPHHPRQRQARPDRELRIGKRGLRGRRLRRAPRWPNTSSWLNRLRPYKGET